MPSQKASRTGDFRTSVGQPTTPIPQQARMRITRKATGALFAGGALGVALAALACPAMLGFGTVAAAPDRVVAGSRRPGR
ncbi:hypothetical protein AB5J55_21775 [Streptomyces sp. R11]|uniref:Uncharacterized protein n=1 Tax=Streptomyces sp. R11 TaxID=3238625 RepID=A0AB39N129_9ACTN